MINEKLVSESRDWRPRGAVGPLRLVLLPHLLWAFPEAKAGVGSLSPGTLPWDLPRSPPHCPASSCLCGLSATQRYLELSGSGLPPPCGWEDGTSDSSPAAGRDGLEESAGGDQTVPAIGVIQKQQHSEGVASRISFPWCQWSFPVTET